MMAFMPGAAHLVDGGGGHARRDAGAEGGLARRRLAEARGQHAAHDDFLHVAPVDRGLERALDGGGAELRRGDAA